MSRLWSLLSNWSSDDQSALRQITKGKTVGERAAAFNRTTINQSKFLLFAGAPFCLVLVARDWFAVITGVMFVGMFREVLRSNRRDR